MAHQRLAALRAPGRGMAAVGALEERRFADLLAAVRLGHDLRRGAPQTIADSVQLVHKTPISLIMVYGTYDTYGTSNELL